jgi:ABC-type Fe3+/spermidine/putrescine transport system ATPase subunit
MQLELKRIQHQVGITFVYVTHDQEEALTMSDRVGVMNDGKLEQVGEPLTLYRSPATAFVASFVGDTNLIDRSWRIGDVNGVPPGLWSLRPEAVAVGAAAQHQPVHVEARVEDVLFLGPMLRYVLRLGEDDDAPRLLALTAASHQPLTRGARTQVGWDPDDLVAIQGPTA